MRDRWRGETGEPRRQLTIRIHVHSHHKWTKRHRFPLFSLHTSTCRTTCFVTPCVLATLRYISVSSSSNAFDDRPMLSPHHCHEYSAVALHSHLTRSRTSPAMAAIPVRPSLPTLISSAPMSTRKVVQAIPIIQVTLADTPSQCTSLVDCADPSHGDAQVQASPQAGVHSDVLRRVRTGPIVHPQETEDLYS